MSEQGLELNSLAAQMAPPILLPTKLPKIKFDTLAQSKPWDLNKIGGISDKVAGYGNMLNSFMPQSKQSDLTGTQQGIQSAMSTGFKAAENIPMVGTFIKAGNAANALMPDFLAGGTAKDQLVNTIPGMKLLNFSVGKTKDFGLNQQVQSSGYGGSASEIANAKSNAGVNVGALTAMFGNKKKLNNQINSAIMKLDKIDDVLTSGNLALQAQGEMASNITNENKFKQAGGWGGNIAVGKEGLKLKDKRDVSRILNNRRKSPFSEYDKFKFSLPENLRDESGYRLQRFWELNGKPSKFEGSSDIYSLEADGYHMPSVGYNQELDEYEFLKPKTHATVGMELDWYNSEDGKGFRDEGWKLVDDPKLDYYKYQKPKSFKEGGKIEHSLIPGGALHAHRHDLKAHDKTLSDSVTRKGVPVVTFEEGGEIEQHAEIERGEIIFRLEISLELEELWKDGSEKAMIKAGKLISKEVVENTKDKSGEYEIDD